MRFCLKCGRWLVNSFYIYTHERSFKHKPLTIQVSRGRMIEYLNHESNLKEVGKK